MYSVTREYARSFHLWWGGSRRSHAVRRTDKQIANRSARRTINQAAHVISKHGLTDDIDPAAYGRKIDVGR